MRNNLSILDHHIFAFKKGLQKLVLYTGSCRDHAQILELLNKWRIAFNVTKVDDKINSLFGAKDCFEFIKFFGNKKLHELNDYEDFILGTLLGYDLKLQCRSYLGNINACWYENTQETDR